ncbi:SanA/YdcF family protein [Gelidibacter salicanalis]|uniref:YdcF family protein n=1 Tax=Gelidibacter salicanalis TaxID=291193 RepID=A0A934NHD7_9FLAO|nr:ElyC/SanA/YdcF family protein [Gelidibacter salicanalis]MBJ7880726.1 YdcF family protein [Gelidibacter salicanalis]
MVLGTSKYLIKGGNNFFYVERMKSTADLYHSNKIDTIIASGDHSDKYYNEPLQIKKSLIALGVPESKIILDEKGINTFQSLKNFKKNHLNNPVIIITQKFHNQRAIYFTKNLKLNAIGINAESLPFTVAPKTYIREYFARVKAFINVQSYILTNVSI